MIPLSEPTDAKAKILVDLSESSSQIDRHLTDQGYSLEKVRLDVGDYQIGGRLAIERKTADDFAASILDGRLFSQAAMMQASGMRSVFLIEGSLSRIQSAINPEALAGAQSALIALYGASMVFTENPQGSARLIGRLFKHLTNGLGYEVPLRQNKPKDPSVQSLFIVESLPGVGPETARKLLKHFGSAKGVFIASENELLEVDGIGRKGAQKIVAALEFGGQEFPTTKNAPATRP